MSGRVFTAIFKSVKVNILPKTTLRFPQFLSFIFIT